MKRAYLLIAAVLVILLALPLFLDKYALGIFVMIFYWAYVGQSWNVLTGYTGHISLGHALYIGIGAYATTYLAQTFGLSPWIGMFVGGIIAVLFALALGFLGFRFGIRGVYFVILTIAFAEITRLIVSHVEALGSFSGIFLDFSPSFWNFQFRGNLPYYYISLGFMVASLVAVRLIEVSKLGRFMVAIREDEEAAQALLRQLYLLCAPQHVIRHGDKYRTYPKTHCRRAGNLIRSGNRLFYFNAIVGNIPGVFRQRRSRRPASYPLWRAGYSGSTLYAQGDYSLCTAAIKTDSATSGK
jgi:hypothetical protein